MTRIAAGSSILLVVLLAGASACSDGTGPRTLATRGDTLPGLIVSQPVSGPAGAGMSARAFASVSTGGSVVYVSLMPGTVPTGLTARIRDQENGLSVTAAVVDGGFDPVALAASVGDTLLVDITRSGPAGPLHAVELVRATHPPVVVRTSPPSGGRDVPLNASIVIVFSDPIDSATLTTGSVRLLRDNTPVPGTVRLSDAAGIRAEFHPDSLLAGQTMYRLVVTPAVQGVDGAALDSAVDVPFTTGTIGPATGLVFASVSADENHTCGVTTSGAAYCWGANNFGQLGNGTLAASPTPLPVVGGFSFVSVSAGLNRVCGVTTAGAAYCWGGGFSAGPSSPVPAPVSRLSAVSIGYSHACGLTAGGAAYCWGEYNSGELGNGTSAATQAPAEGPVPVSGGLTFASVSAGGKFTCGVAIGGAAYCWGTNSFGQLGIGTQAGPQVCWADTASSYTDYCSPTPLPVSGGLSFVSISAGWNQACGVTTDGAAYCWGGGGPHTIPELVGGGLTFGSVSVSDDMDFTACGVTTAGAAYCWFDRGSPSPVGVGLSFASISVGYAYTCGVTTDGAAYCWGQNSHGQLGNGTTTDSSVPVKVAGQR
jgi:alpha-tubulin suppressor-like RCC1 family protein